MPFVKWKREDGSHIDIGEVFYQYLGFEHTEDGYRDFAARMREGEVFALPNGGKLIWRKDPFPGFLEASGRLPAGTREAEWWMQPGLGLTHPPYGSYPDQNFDPEFTEWMDG
ncbi:MAG: hypothetical protein KJ622_11390 [Alphaproteobacteria bacterium]|nr:hypothetical protein [Alphaproteobacteria bacterium]